MSEDESTAAVSTALLGSLKSDVRELEKDNAGLRKYCGRMRTERDLALSDARVAREICERIARKNYVNSTKESGKYLDLNAPQPKPIQTTERPVYAMVIDDLRERAEAGEKKYGMHLQASNGRDHLVDAYQEILDLTQYIRALIERQASE